jgi:chemotaxis protein CheD
MINLKRYTVFPGQYVITSVPTLISTILGSCVSVCLWDRELKTGGMNHFLLPGTVDDSPGNADRGITSIPLLINSMLNRRSAIVNLEAKVFGGCNSLYKENNTFKIGERNAAIAFELLKDYSITVSASHVGGSYGRKIVFNTATGKVRMRLLVETAVEINEKINKGFNY